MLKKCEDGLVVHHEAACRDITTGIERFQRFGCLQLCGRNAPGHGDLIDNQLVPDGLWD
jgi:hypothetical protein